MKRPDAVGDGFTECTMSGRALCNFTRCEYRNAYIQLKAMSVTLPWRLPLLASTVDIYFNIQLPVCVCRHISLKMKPQIQR